MATFREMVYMVNDLLKLNSDDSFYTEEHILFLLSKMRSLLLMRNYTQTRNSTFSPLSEQNKQEICLDLETADMLAYGCAGNWLRSVHKLPEQLDISTLSVYPVNSMLHSTIRFIPEERMPYVGYNKWLKNIIYCSKAGDGHLYMHGRDSQFLFLEKVKASGIFADPEEAAKYSCDPDGEGGCEIMDQNFPLEEAMVPSCIEMVVQELSGSRFAPKDNKNNAKDDLSDAGLNTRPVRAARDEERNQAKDAKDANS